MPRTKKATALAVASWAATANSAKNKVTVSVVMGEDHRDYVAYW